MASIQFTEADRDAKGFIAVEPRSLADLLPQAIKQDAKRARHTPTRHEIAAIVAVTLALAFVVVYTWQPQATAPANALPLPTAYIAPQPTHAPQPTPTIAPTSIPLPAVVAPVQRAPAAQQDTMAVMGAPVEQADTAPAIIPEDIQALNDPTQNGNNLAPPGCPFPIINGICGNGARAKDVSDVPPRDGRTKTK